MPLPTGEASKPPSGGKFDVPLEEGLLKRPRRLQAIVDQTCGRVPATLRIQNDQKEISAVLGYLRDKTPARL